MDETTKLSPAVVYSLAMRSKSYREAVRLTIEMVSNNIMAPGEARRYLGLDEPYAPSIPHYATARQDEEEKEEADE